jgi:hypothetical protein
MENCMTRTNNRFAFSVLMGFLLFVPCHLICSGQSLRPVPEVLSTPNDSKQATVYFYRPNRIYGMALHPSIYCDGQELLRLHSGTYFSIDLPAGKHMLSSGRSEVGQFVDLESGKAYFFRFDLKKSSMFTGAPPVLLVPVPAETAKAEMKDLKIAEPKE